MRKSSQDTKQNLLAAQKTASELQGIKEGVYSQKKVHHFELSFCRFVFSMKVLGNLTLGRSSVGDLRWEGKASWLGTSYVSSRSNGSCSKCFWQRITVSPVAHSAQSLENGSHLRPHVTALTGIPRSGHSIPERVADFRIARWTGQAGLVCRGFLEA